MNDIIISLAKASIFVALGQPDTFDLEKALRLHPSLNNNGAVFVTIMTKDANKLRGCIGSLQAYRPLYKDIIVNARAAALEDTRFEPLQKNELDNITIEVSILNDPKPLTYTNTAELKKYIKPYIDGVVLTYDGHKATYLPGVWEQIPDFDDFFRSLCLKAGLESQCLAFHPDISTYQVVKYKENDGR